MHSDVTLSGKKTLVELSHAIERFALAAEPGQPLLVIAMFQKLSYFRREVDVYRAIAESGAVTIVGLAEDLPPELPPGVQHALVGADEPLAREWSVTVLGPKGGATLVALDQEDIDPQASTLEAGRRFRGQWSFRRTDAYGEILRLRSQLQLPPATIAEIDAVLRTVLDEPEPMRQEWWDVPLRFLGDRMHRAVQGRAAAVSALEAARENDAELDPRTGLRTRAFLQRWTAGLGGGLSIGMLLLRVTEVAGLRERYGLRAELAALQGIRTVLAAPLRDSDRVIRIGPEDFLVVLPSWRPDDVTALGSRACAQIVALDQVYPFVPLTATAVTTVTRQRPLPVAELAQRLGADPRVATSA